MNVKTLKDTVPSAPSSKGIATGSIQRRSLQWGKIAGKTFLEIQNHPNQRSYTVVQSTTRKSSTRCGFEGFLCLHQLIRAPEKVMIT